MKPHEAQLCRADLDAPKLPCGTARGLGVWSWLQRFMSPEGWIQAA